MYKCNNCGAFFEEPEHIKDDPSASGVALTAGYYEYSICPCCGAEEDFKTAYRCSLCGEWTTNELGVCDDCMENIEYDLDKVRSDYKLTRDDFEAIVVEIFNR